MEVIKTIQALRETIQQLKAKKINENQCVKVGFVPTMGFLHQGHLSLLEKAKKQCDIVVLSIFVNPLQFGANEDFSTYPRDEQRDLKMAEQMNVDVVFIPQNEEIYPQRMKTNISVSEFTDIMCGAARPGHFDGVATVVLKLFHIVQPDRAYFGMKDAQQVAVIEQMVKDLNINIDIVPCPIVRESDGLAMSSRNVYLSPDERSQAVVLSQSLKNIQQRIFEEKNFDLTIEQAKHEMKQFIDAKPLAVIDYIEIVAYPSMDTFSPNERIHELLLLKPIIIALAVKFGKTRLIDNMLMSYTNRR